MYHCRPEELRYRAGGAGENGILGTAVFPPVAAVLELRASGEVLNSTREERVGENENRGSRVSAGRGYLGDGGNCLEVADEDEFAAKGGGGYVVWASPVSAPAGEVLGRGRGPSSIQKTTAAPAMARAGGRECFAMNAIQSVRV